MPPYGGTNTNSMTIDVSSPASSPINGAAAASIKAAANATSSSPSTPTAVSIGAPVLTAFGLGTVHALPSLNNSIMTVELESWKLAGSSPVLCYLRFPHDVTVLSTIAVSEMTVAQKIEYAKLCKDLGVGALQNGRLLGTSLLLHETALDVTRSMLQADDDLSLIDADQRSTLFLTMVKGHNHAASCALGLDLCRKARDHAKNAIAILDALEKKAAAGQSPMASNGTANTTASTMSLSTLDSAKLLGQIKLNGESRCKSLIFVARSYLEDSRRCRLRHCELARASLDEANSIIKQYSSDKELLRMPEMKAVLKQFVSHRRNIQKYKRVCKQVQANLVNKHSNNNSDNYATSYSTWFANKRVWFADDSSKRSRAAASSSNSKDASSTTPAAAAGWTQTAATLVAYTGFVALGAFMVHQACLLSTNGRRN